MDVGTGPWPDDFVWKQAVPEPARWGRPGIVMFFNLECAGCIARGVPFLKDLHREFGDRLVILAIHTAYGHRDFPRDQVVPQLVRFAESFAALPFPVALDLSGEIAEAWRAQGTPHWLVFDSTGALSRSIFGSQENAQTRLRYLLEELVGEG